MKRTLAVLAYALLPIATPHAVAQPAPSTQTAVVDEQAAIIVNPVVDRLDHAWDAGDGRAFAGEFTGDADVINIFGEAFKGGEPLVQRMQLIFDGIFKGSRHSDRKLEIARYLAPDTILAVTSSHVLVPAGPMSPETRNRQTLILVRDGDAWRIRHWHNTTLGRPGS